MIVSIGTDIVEIARLELAIERQGERFIERIFTEAERAYCESQTNTNASFAARFAAKEAAFKMIGTGWAEGVAWRDAEVHRNDAGAPSLVLSGEAAKRAEQLGITRVHLSMSHSDSAATATVIGENA